MRAGSTLGRVALEGAVELLSCCVLWEGFLLCLCEVAAWEKGGHPGLVECPSMSPVWLLVSGDWVT